MRAMCVVGARPNFMKIKPILDALEELHVETILVHTGQHYDESLSAVFLRDLDLRNPDFLLGVGSGSHAQQTAQTMIAFEKTLGASDPDVVIVVGDVNSTLACALVATKMGIPVAHVEAGLRSHDWTMPEEINRVLTDRISRFLFAPSKDAVDHLLNEGISPDSIHMVGNVMIDTLMSAQGSADERPILGELGLSHQGYALVTLHRPVNVDVLSTLRGIFKALSEIANTLPVVLPAHPRLQIAMKELPAIAELQLIEPVGYLDFLKLEMSARLILTDSGGIQEEATVLGIPCLTLRRSTERPVTLEGGVNRIVGTDPARIVAEFHRALASRTVPFVPPLWDGRTSSRIAGILVSQLSN